MAASSCRCRISRTSVSLPDAPPVLSLIGDRAVGPARARDRCARGVARRPPLAAQPAAALGGAGFVVISGLARGITPRQKARRPARRGWPAASTKSTRRRTPHAGDRRPRPGIAEAPLALRRSPALPRCNRIVSGLAAGVVAIEAAARPGADAQRAVEQGARSSSCRARRWIRAMPGPTALSGMGPFCARRQRYYKCSVCRSPSRKRLKNRRKRTTHCKVLRWLGRCPLRLTNWYADAIPPPPWRRSATLELKGRLRGTGVTAYL
jgi:hypothetical protein